MEFAFAICLPVCIFGSRCKVESMFDGMDLIVLMVYLTTLSTAQTTQR
jgi:hypothetical protein